MGNPLRKLPHPWYRALHGLALSLVAPLGWWLLSRLFLADRTMTPVYLAYLTVASGGLLASFGYVLGRAEERAARTAHTDHLTGLCNARRFHERLEADFANARRYGSHLCLLVLDLDHFKRVNDTYGHQSGDVVLRSVAQTVLGAARAGDTVARVGGEEFAAILPATDSRGGQNLAERIRRLVADKPIRLPNGFAITVTLSGGVAGLDQVPAAMPSALFAAADQALYTAKETGRNKVVVARVQGQPTEEFTSGEKHAMGAGT